jgi:hypothetical protein
VLSDPRRSAPAGHPGTPGGGVALDDETAGVVARHKTQIFEALDRWILDGIARPIKRVRRSPMRFPLAARECLESAPNCRCSRLITSWVRHGPLIAAASGPPIIQAVLWAGILLAS